jgi:hypothetical protein
LFQPGRRVDRTAFKELRAGLPFLDIAIAGPKRFAQYVTRLIAAMYITPNVMPLKK